MNPSDGHVHGVRHPAAVRKPGQNALGQKLARNPNACYAVGQCWCSHREGVIIARFKLRLHFHVAGECGPDERVSLRNVGMIGELLRYVVLVAKDFRHPFANRVLGAGETAPSLGNKVDATWHRAGIHGPSARDAELV